MGFLGATIAIIAIVSQALMIIQNVTQMEQGAVIAILVATTVLVLALLSLLGIVVWRGQQVLQYGNFLVVALGIMAALIGFIVAFPLLVSGVFSDPTQVIALLSALFGAIVGLVGTFFGVKASSDARQGAVDLAARASTGVVAPTVVSVTPPADVKDVAPATTITATFSRDMDSTSIKDTDHFTLVRIDPQGMAHVRVLGKVDYGPPKCPPRVATFIPDNPLENDYDYQATLTRGVRDLEGNALAEDYTWQFRVCP